MALTGQIVMGQAIMVKSSEVRPATCPHALTLSAYGKRLPGRDYSQACKDDAFASLQGHGGL